MTLSHTILMLTLSLMLAVLSSGQAPAMSPSTTTAPLPLVKSPPPVMMTPSPFASASPPDMMTPPAMSPGTMDSPPAPMAPAMGPIAQTPSTMGKPPVTSSPGSAAFKHGSSLAVLASLAAALLV